MAESTSSQPLLQFSAQAKAVGARCFVTVNYGSGTPTETAGTQTLATSYAANALPFLQAMKSADPLDRIGVPWAFGSQVSGASVPDNTEWNNAVLGQDGRYISFVDAHYYPFHFGGSTGGSNLTDQQVLQSLMSIPSLYQEIRTELSACW